jgi:hypothetical protein
VEFGGRSYTLSARELIVVLFFMCYNSIYVWECLSSLPAVINHNHEERERSDGLFNIHVTVSPWSVERRAGEEDGLSYSVI